MTWRKFPEGLRAPRGAASEAETAAWLVGIVIPFFVVRAACCVLRARFDGIK